MTTSSKPALPPVAIVLGALAVLPFLTGAALVWLVPPDWRSAAAFALSAYAATVVSFIGAIHWGIAFTRPEPAVRSLVWGVVPAIVACGALLVAPRAGLVVHAAMLVVCYGVDRVTYPLDGVLRWLRLRFAMTVCAVLACVAGSLAA